MPPDLDELLRILLELCTLAAVRDPTPADPPEPEWIREADETCRRLARTQEMEELSPEVACALLPRLRAARRHGARVAASLTPFSHTTTGEEAARALLEALLVTLWHAEWEKAWQAGERV